MIEAFIRPGRRADVEQLVAPRREFTFEDLDPNDAVSRPGYEAECREFRLEAVSGEKWQIWVAELDGSHVAHAFVALIDKVPRPISERSRITYLTNVYTRPDVRGKGIGARIIRKAQAAAREADVELMIVWPSEESAKFYERESFESPDDLLVWQAG